MSLMLLMSLLPLMSLMSLDAPDVPVAAADVLQASGTELSGLHKLCAAHDCKVSVLSILLLNN